MDIKETNCVCTQCVGACKNTPGWFGGPDEILALAKFMGISAEEVFKKYLVVDFHMTEDAVRTLVVSPFKHAEPEVDDCAKFAQKMNPWATAEDMDGKIYDHPGTLVSFSFPYRSGDCVFLKDDRCSIYEVRPQECRESDHDKDSQEIRVRIKDKWHWYQTWITWLTGIGADDGQV